MLRLHRERGVVQALGFVCATGVSSKPSELMVGLRREPRAVERRPGEAVVRRRAPRPPPLRRRARAVRRRAGSEPMMSTAGWERRRPGRSGARGCRARSADRRGAARGLLERRWSARRDRSRRRRAGVPRARPGDVRRCRSRRRARRPRRATTPRYRRSTGHRPGDSDPGHVRSGHARGRCRPGTRRCSRSPCGTTRGKTRCRAGGRRRTRPRVPTWASSRLVLGEERDAHHLQAIGDGPCVVDLTTEGDALLERDAPLLGTEPQLGVAPCVQRPRGRPTRRRRSPPSRGLPAPGA